MTPLLRTELALAALRGTVEDLGSHRVIRAPHIPGSFQRHALVLPGPPVLGSLPRWSQVMAETFPEKDHVNLRWEGPPASEALLAEAHALGFEPEGGQEMLLSSVSGVATPPDLSIRPLDPTVDLPRMTALNLAGDPTEQSGLDPHYTAFKRDIRDEAWDWFRSGDARWWGAWRGDELVAQCGLLDFPPHGRFQAVETHPDHRRQGVCSALVAAVCRDALARGLETLVLEAELDGPALGLYRRLGFRDGGQLHRLLETEAPLLIRDEASGDYAGVAALVTAAFGQPDEARLVAALRGQEGVTSLVLERAGDLLGHLLFSPVRVQPDDGPAWPAMALAPVAITPRHQGRGLGSQLIEAGLDRLRAAGHDVCVLLGHPDYYPRFGFRPAPPLGLTCRWEVPDPVFQVLALQPGSLAGRTGRVHYHPAFDAL